MVGSQGGPEKLLPTGGNSAGPPDRCPQLGCPAVSVLGQEDGVWGREPVLESRGLGFVFVSYTHTNALFKRAYVCTNIHVGTLLEPQCLHPYDGVNNPFTPEDCGDGIRWHREGPDQITVFSGSGALSFF